jgi:polyhydroxyalkanoate synthase
VHPEPILIVPAWIMKYYILDLSPHNSLIKYLVDQGHTVFMHLLDQPRRRATVIWAWTTTWTRVFTPHSTPSTPSCPRPRCTPPATAWAARCWRLRPPPWRATGDERLASMTLFAAQTDFTEPGELALFIDDSQISLLEAQMAETGYLTGAQMAGAFQMLRSYDLLWSRLVNEYLLGERAPMNDLMAWNADTTRMPAKMHSQYLRRLFLDDDLSEGRYPVGGKPVTLGDITLPTFMVGTVTDHVAPWRSVFKLQQLSPAENTFVLTSGGHNAGIVSPPGLPGCVRSTRYRHHPWAGLTTARGAGRRRSIPS